MEELVNFMERVPKAQSATCWKNKEIQRLDKPRMYTKKIVSLGFAENIYFKNKKFYIGPI